MNISTSTNPLIVEILLLYDGVRAYSVKPEFFGAVRRAVLEVVPALLPGEGYTAKMLCGPELWRVISDQDRRLAGRCIADMERNGLLPLRRLGCRHKNPARYALR